MKILLINPPRSPYNNILKYAPEKARPFIHRKLIGPPLGLLTLAAAVKDSHDVLVLEMKAEYDLNPHTPDYPKLTEKYLNDFNPDIVGVTFIASEYNDGIKILKTVKKLNKEILTVAGGIHATLCPEDFNNDAVDVVCLGQSAHSFKALVEAKECGHTFEHIANLLVRTERGLESTPVVPTSCDFTGKDYIMPDRSFIKRWINTYKVGRAPFPSTYIYTSLGCPYRCTFCSIWPQFKGEYLERDVESIIAELKTIEDYPIVRFADANTIVNIDFINRLFNRIEEEGIKKEYIMDIRVDTAVKQPELIEKLAKNGLRVVISGFESIRKEELKKYNKSSKNHFIEKAISVFHDNGIKLRGNYIIPPEYNKNDFKVLSEYVSTHKIVYAGYTILTPMPGSILYKEIKDNIIDHDLAKYNFFNCVLKTHLPLEKFYREVGKLWSIRKGKDTI